MDPYRENAPLDETEVETTKVREAEATKRHLITEREETKRRDIANRDTPGYVVPRLAIAVVAIAAAIAGYHTADSYFEHQHPTPTAATECTEATEVITSGDSRKECRGGYIETEHLVGGTVIFRCRCSRNDQLRQAARPDGGS